MRANRDAVTFRNKMYEQMKWSGTFGTPLGSVNAKILFFFNF